MKNLLETPITETELAALLAGRVGRPLLPPLDSPEWEKAKANPVLKKWMKQIQVLADPERDEPLPALPDSLYAHFYKTGKTLPFKNVYFERRRKLGRSALMVLMGDPATRQRDVSSLLDKAGGIMSEESWTFPDHVWNEPTGKDPMMIDLFAAETANLMGELLDLFGAIMPADFARRIRERLHTQTFENYARRHEQFTWTRLPMNWNAVCHQGVIGSALAVESDDKLVARILSLAGKSLPLFMSGFGADGSTSEGPGYWSYGFGRFAELNAQLEARTGGGLSFFGNNEHIKRIAEFAPALVFSNRHLVNFSDGFREGSLNPSLLLYLGKRLDLPDLCAEGIAGYRQMAESGIDLHEHRCDVFYLTRLFLRCPDLSKPQPEPSKKDVFLPDYGAVVARGTDAAGNLWEFSAKGGHNAEHHNHNDCGSFVLNLNGQPALIEIGAGEYVHGYFSEPRYTFLATRSLGHSVPFVNGCEQSAGAEFAARVTTCEMGADRVKFIVDLTRCYPPEAHCRSLLRSFIFDKVAGRIEIADAFELEEAGSVESVLICEAPVFGEGGLCRIDASGGTLQIIPGDGILLSKVESCDYSNHVGIPSQVNRLRLHPSSSTQRGVIRYEIRAVSR